MGVHAGSSSHQLKSLEMVKHVIDIGVPEKLRLSERSIYKVPCNLRDVKKDAYTPYCISIGPIHLGTKELDTMQEHKLRYYQFFWDRVSNEEAMESYKHYLQNKEQEIRRCYSEKFTFPTEQFVDMMLLDAAFIMELFLRNCEAKSQSLPDSDDLIMKQSWLARDIARDLILLENQIPFFVLLELYEKVVPDYQRKKEHTGFVDLAFEYFAFYDPQMWPFSNNQETKKGNFCCSKEPCKPKSKGSSFKDLKPKHFTDLIRFSYLPTNQTKGQPSDHVPRTATKLQDSGVYFEKGGGKRKLLDVTFEKKQILSLCLCFGCLQCLNHFKARFRIPQLKVDHNTECLFRNLIAFEQCHYPDETNYICNYVSLIDSLIHTQLDVELLVEKEVIVHELGSHKEVASLVNGLCKHVVTNSTCYYDTIKGLNDHYKNKWYHTMASLRLVYFRDLWRASSTVVGIAVLIFAVFQFLRALRALFKM
ncbi:hypothetical protein LR48_Vigan11g169000 [Vigna angularis]|uniref:Uncharacterized protein n=2 Tax=Phaseolus angularis TaxID=3914 RepID=A0A0L9VU91_PHAAN|nr:UPF0481 protein At3g47200 [Vigna angularis]KOM58656.1 hypothetical protein LR48_Vigan11g169000 [Vigna angularis]BAT96799.1 hypothetical protein VIGAN_09010200 [Vigna angularis var. angularis]